MKESAMKFFILSLSIALSAAALAQPGATRPGYDTGAGGINPDDARRLEDTRRQDAQQGEQRQQTEAARERDRSRDESRRNAAGVGVGVDAEGGRTRGSGPQVNPGYPGGVGP